jgi:hypothetical protein
MSSTKTRAEGCRQNYLAMIGLLVGSAACSSADNANRTTAPASDGQHAAQLGPGV